jgi:hypothetical protein
MAELRNKQKEMPKGFEHIPTSSIRFHAAEQKTLADRIARDDQLALILEIFF